jgi:phenylalanyl-tRNA synthetase alpha chain
MLRKYGPVCKVAIPWKVYRNEKKDATHDTMFWQLDWIVVDKWLSIAHFKSSIETILGEILERKVNIRLRPSYFPFTEPSFEIDVKVIPEDGRLRQLSKETWWIELLGAGMIHHKLLTMAGIDPEVYSWFAFGIGLTRLVAIKHMLHDVRLLTDNDLKFIQSF